MKLEYLSLDFGNYIKKNRKKHNMTQVQLGQKIGVHENSIARWEKGDFFPPLNNAEEIIKLFGGELVIRELGDGQNTDE